MKTIYQYFNKSLKLLESKDKIKFQQIAFIQIMLGIFDLIGVTLMGILGALSISGIQSREPGVRVYSVLKILKIESLSFQTQSALIALLALFFLVGKTLISIFFTRKSLYFLSIKGAEISGKLISFLLNRNIQETKKRGSQDILYSATSGVYSITNGILSTGLSLLADISAVLLVMVGLIIFDPVIAILTFVLFFVIAISIFRLQQDRARKIGLALSEQIVRSEEQILEVLGSFRELFVHNRQDFYTKEILKQRLRIAASQAEMSFMPQISKYVIEVSVLVGGLLVGAVQFLRLDAYRGFATLALFLAAGSRIAPAIMRAQQNLVTIRSSLGVSATTFSLIEELYAKNKGINEVVDEMPNWNQNIFKASVVFKNVSFKFDDSNTENLSNVSFSIVPGTIVAIVGPSGAGKSTLVDLMLGILEPTTGSIQISNLPPSFAIKKWPGKISYVPQDVVITKSNLLENIGLGFSKKEIDRNLALKSAKLANLEDLVDFDLHNLSMPILERGTNLSGGQRQRIGIARALYTQPKLIVLDEATSALDVITEHNITNTFRQMKGEVTLILIAHRLSTVRDADLVIYVDSGRVLAQGTFEQVRNEIPQFDQQAKLLGL